DAESARDAHAPRGADTASALRHRGEVGLHPRGGRPALRGDARAHPADRGEGAPQAPEPEPRACAGDLRTAAVGGRVRRITNRPGGPRPGRLEDRMLENLEKELRKWRQSRASKPQREAPSDRRTVKVNGQEVLVVRKKAKPKTEE